MKQLLTYTLLLLSLPGKAQIHRLYAEVSTSYSVPANPANVHVDSTYYRYAGDDGLSAINGKFLPYHILNYRDGQLHSEHVITYTGNDDEEKREGYPQGTNVGKYLVQNTYDVQNRLLTSASETDYGQGIFQHTYIRYTYTPTGKPDSMISRTENTGSPIIHIIHRYEYNSLDSVTKLTEQRWDSAGNTLTDTRRYLYTYNAQNLPVEELQQLWNNGQWNDNSKSIYSYDAAGKKTTISYEAYNTGAWMYLGKRSYLYDAQGSITEDNNYDNVTGNDVLVVKNIFTYNTEGFRASYERIRYERDSTFRNYVYYYYGTEWPTAIAEQTKKNGLRMYPNPANNIINIHLNNTTRDKLQILIYNTQGMLMTKQEVLQTGHDITIPVGRLSAGEYVIEINGSGTGSKGTFIIAR